jgi:hypothetical protein
VKLNEDTLNCAQRPSPLTAVLKLFFQILFGCEESLGKDEMLNKISLVLAILDIYLHVWFREINVSSYFVRFKKKLCDKRKP